MLYLGRDSFYDEEKNQHYFILKIGYTADENRDKRLLNYTYHNPSFKFIVEIPEGTEEQEKKLHEKFKEYLHHGNEWFLYKEEIVDFMRNCTLEDIDKLKSPLKKEGKLVSKYPRIKIKDNWKDEIKDFFLGLNKCNRDYLSRVKYICEFLVDNPNLKESIIENLSDHYKIKQQLIILGPERIMSLGYNITKINRAMGITIFDMETLNVVIFSEFIVGEKYTKKYIKEKLGEIYKAADFKETPKANQLELWFEIKDIKILNSKEGKREPGFEIIKKK